MSFKKTAFILLAGLAFSPLTAHAGFGFNSADQTIDISNQPGVPSWTPPAGSQQPEVGATRPVSDATAPALQIFNERYIPDSIKKKYGIQDEWYGENAASLPVPGPGPQPLIVNDGPAQLTPDDMSLPPEDQATGAMPVPISAPADTPAPAAAPVMSAAAYAKLESWRARKGETVREILKRWSDREGTELMWASADNPALKQDFSYVGTMSDAVAKLIQASGTQLYTQYRSNGLDPVMMTPAATMTSSTPALNTAAAPDKTVGGVPYNLFAPQPKQGPETRWFALSGASLQEVLQVWAEDEGAALIWQGQGNFALKDSVSQTGHFEDAVFKALSQYNGDGIRPIGQLYNDPATGRKVLVVKTETTS